LPGAESTFSSLCGSISDFPTGPQAFPENASPESRVRLGSRAFDFKMISKTRQRRAYDASRMRSELKKRRKSLPSASILGSESGLIKGL